MSKKIAIIESDSTITSKLRAELESKGFAVTDTGDGKTAIDLIKRERPDLIVLSVELSAGQSGYILCGKLKKDEELKRIPIVVTGKDAEGFESHKRLKARAEEYLKKPFEPPALIEKIAALIGLPEINADDLVLEDESLNLGTVGNDEPMPEHTPGGRADPDLDMLDAAFETIAEDPKSGTRPPPPPPSGGEEQISMEAMGEDSLIEHAPVAENPPPEDPSDGTLSDIDPLPMEDKGDEVILEAIDPVDEGSSFAPAPETSQPRARVSRPASPMPNDNELLSLRDKVSDLENHVRELDGQLTAKTNELEAFQTTAGGRDKDFFALRDQNAKKDREIVRLKGEVNERDNRIVELEEKHIALEQKTSELTTELAKKDAQIKTLTQRLESAANERKKLESSLALARDEIRQLSAKLSVAQGELDQAQEAQSELHTQIESSRAEAASLKSALDSANKELEQAKVYTGELKTRIEQLEVEAERALRLDQEVEGQRKRIGELEETSAKNEQRAIKAYQKIKADEKTREKVKKAVSVALQMLDEGAAAPVDGERADENVVS